MEAQRTGAESAPALILNRFLLGGKEAKHGALNRPFTAKLRGLLSFSCSPDIDNAAA